MNAGISVSISIYLSGPLFSRAEIAWAGNVKALLEKRLGAEAEVIWPHEIAHGSSSDIFKANLQALNECDIMVALLDGPQVDDGTAWEIGYFYALERVILGVRTDLRKAGEAPESKVNAMIENSCTAIVEDLDGLVSELSRMLD
jgi:nucleoside 2-deoxyribosyltransferase